jgi:Ser/Thr protein kinase RdoA (MazF antagonist)
MDHIREYRQWYSFDIDFLEEVATKTKVRISSAFHKNKPGYGICHGDFNPGNIRLDSNDNPVLFDFDFSGYGWRTYDISVYINAFSLGWDNSGMEKRKRRREAFLKGYRAVMQLSDNEFDNMYLFVPFRRIFNIGTLYISMSNTWGDNWVNTNLYDDIETLKKWTEITGY